MPVPASPGIFTSKLYSHDDEYNHVFCVSIHHTEYRVEWYQGKKKKKKKNKMMKKTKKKKKGEKKLY